MNTPKVCTLEDKGQPCNLMMITRQARPGKLGQIYSLPGDDKLYVCSRHDGDAASVYQTNPHYNRPRKDDSK